MAKAFDTVDHNILLSSLDDLGVKGKSHDLFNSYLTDRKQQTKIQNILSKKETISCGVPQGTVLRPLLFNIYLNNLFSIRTQGSIISFADDTVIFYERNTWDDLKNKIETDFGNIKKWFDNRLLSINFKKTFYLPFCSLSANLPTFDKISIEDDLEILPSKRVKYLDIMIDSHLRWDVHINYLVKKLRSVLYRIKQVSHILNIKQKKILYHSLVESHLGYGIIGWGGVSKTYLKSLEIIQKRFLKLIMCRKNRYPSEALFEETQVYDLRKLDFLEVGKTQYLHKNELLTHSHQHKTRQKDKFIPPFMKKSVGQRCYRYLGPKVFNCLPDNIKNAPTIQRFTTTVKDYIRELPTTYVKSIIENN